MSFGPDFPDGYYDDNGEWQRTKFCHVSCGTECTCMPPFGAFYSAAHDKRRQGTTSGSLGGVEGGGRANGVQTPDAVHVPVETTDAAPKSVGGSMTDVRPSNQKLRLIEPYRSKDGVTAEVYFSKLGGTGAVVIEADTGTGEEAEVVLSMQEAHDLMLWLRCAIGMNAVETTERREKAWLIESGAAAPNTEYRYMDQMGFHWSKDVNKAIRFARREDAEMAAAGDEDAWSIVEHEWVTLGSPLEPEAPTFQTPQFAGLAFRHWSKDPAVPYAECQCDTCLPLKAPCCDGSGKIPYTDEQARERVKRCNICQPKPIAEGAIDPDDKGHKP